MPTSFLRSTVIGLAIAFPLSGANAQSFTGIGSLSSTGAMGSYANGLTADGSVIVGSSYLTDPTSGSTVAHAIRWTPGGGMSDLGVVSLSASVGLRTSNDGNTVTGYSGFVTGNGDIEPRNAVYWTSASANPQGTLITNVTDRIGYIANDVSADGSFIVGQTRAPGLSPVPDQAFYYTQSDGIQIFSLPAGQGTPASANAVSADGSVVVGYSEGPSALAAWRWTAATGVQILAGAPAGTPAAAYGVSANGQVIVGEYDSQAMRWTPGGLFQSIGIANLSSHATDASGDGSVVVGSGYFDINQTDPTAFIWDAVHGMRDLRDVLVNEFHLNNLSGWTLTEATGISDDGLTIVGNGFDPLGNKEGWVAHIPAPGALPLLGIALGIAGRRRR